MKNKKSNVGSFATAKLQAKRRSLLAILVTVLVFTMTIVGCDNDSTNNNGSSGGGGTSADPLNGTWKTGDGETITLTNGSFVIAQNNKQGMRGTYTTSAKSVSANISLAVKELHGDFLTEEIKKEGIDKTFESKWLTKEQFIDAFKKMLKELGKTDAQITAYLNEHSSDLNAMYSTITGTIDGDTMFLAVDGGTTYTKDGGSTNPGSGNMTWTKVTNSPFGTSYYSGLDAIAYGNGTFVAGGHDVGSVIKMAYSSDGKTWTAVDVGSVFGTSNIRAIAYGNGKFVTGDAYSSDNGKTWTAIPYNKSASASAIAYGNNMFVAVGYSGSTAYSSDGITWTAIANANRPFGTGSTAPDINGIAYGNNKFVAVGRSGTMAYSTDGTSWTAIPTTIFDYLDDGSTYKADICAIAYGNGKFVAVGGATNSAKIAYSSDGVTWTPVNTSTLFIVSSGNQSGQLYPTKIVSGTNKFVAVSDGGMATSTDGVTWTAVTQGGLGNISAIAYGNGTFVAGYQNNGSVYYSTGN